MKRLKVALATFMVAVFGVATLAPAGLVSAYDPLDAACKDQSATSSEVCKDENRDDNAGDLINTIINTLLFIVGSLSVIMIIVGGIFYVTSTGDSGRVARAKNTIMYSVVGLIVSIFAYAIVNWVITLF